MKPWDITIVGGGILGTSLAYWLAERYDARVVALEKEDGVARHASGRNTGVIHRPFYLDPISQRIFAKCSQAAFGMWKEYAHLRDLPWIPVGTLEVATDPSDFPVLEKYVEWARENGMGERELILMHSSDVRRLEPQVKCEGAVLSTTDSVVDYRALTEALKRDAEALGAKFLLGTKVSSFFEKDDVLRIYTQGKANELESKFLINAGGGNSVDIAHAAGVAFQYTDLHFRGEYWKVGERASSLVSRNAYSVPRHKDLPFLDPHWIVRSDGTREIGPNAVPVPAPYAYDWRTTRMREWLSKLFEPPISNKLRIWLNEDFLALSLEEAWSSLSKGEMVRRVQRFIPSLRKDDLTERGTAGIRSVVVDRRGNMIKEAIEVPGHRSYHILNYNSPGATGAPAYAAYIVDRLAARGDLDYLTLKRAGRGPWNWEDISRRVGLEIR